MKINILHKQKIVFFGDIKKYVTSHKKGEENKKPKNQYLEFCVNLIKNHYK